MTRSPADADLYRAYLHPEVLAAETLVAILRERCIKLEKLEGMTKCQLVELFYDHVLPLPQRIYGAGRRAQRLTQRRHQNESLKRKCEESPNWIPHKNLKSGIRNNDNEKSQTDDNKNSTNEPKRTYKLVNRSTSDPVPTQKRVSEKTSNETNCKEIATAIDGTPTKKSKRTPISWP